MLNKYDFDLIIKKIWRAKFPFIYNIPVQLELKRGVELV